MKSRHFVLLWHVNVTNVVALACFCDDVATRHAHFDSLEPWVSRISHVKTFLATTRKGGCLSTVAVSAIERSQSTFLAKENACGWGEVGVEEWALKLQRGVTAGSERVLLEERHKQMTGEVWSSGSLRRIHFTFLKYRHYKFFIFNFLEQPAHLSLFSSIALNIQHVNLEKLENLHRHRTEDFTSSRVLVVRRGDPFRISLQLAGRAFNPTMDKLRIKVMLGNLLISFLKFDIFMLWYIWLINTLMISKKNVHLQQLNKGR